VPSAYMLVEGPAFTPLRFGLLSAAQLDTPGDPHWYNGVQWQPDVCQAALSLSAVCVTGAGPTGSPVTGSPSLGAEPFKVYALIQCAPIGQGQDLGRLKARADAALTNGEGRALEHVFWTGATGDGGTVRPHLAANATAFGPAQGAMTVQLQSAATVLNGGTALDVVEALGSLEGSLAACYGGEGVIHVPRAAVPHLSNKALVRAEGAQLRTTGGNLVAAYGPGDRTAPDGSTPAAGQAYFYATGAVQYRRGPVQHVGVAPLPEAFDRASNTVAYQAYRWYQVGWDCCHFAVNVSLGGDITGTQGTAT
jgi:hypothetical protein